MKFIDWLTRGEEREKETEFLPAILEVTESPPSPTGRLVLWTVMALILIAVIWAFVGHINEVAVAEGTVVPSGQAKTVQVKDKGIVQEILVKEGDVVEEGQTLVVLDPTSTGADMSSLKKRIAYYKLDIARLTAELNGEPFIPTADPDLETTDLSAELALYQSRTNDYQTQKRAAQEIVDQKMARLAATQATYEKYAKGLEIAQDKERRLESLVAENAISEFQLLEQRTQRIEYEKNAQAELDTITSTRGEIAEAQSRLANVDASYKKDIMTALVASKKELYSIEEALKKAEQDARLATIVSPASGKVYNLSIHTVGGIVTDAQPLMMIVPNDSPLEFEVYAQNRDIGFIKTGQDAEVKVSTFNFQRYGMVDAVVDEIAATAVSNSNDREKNEKFKLILKPVKNNIDVQGEQVELTPGMNVTAEIKIREKRIIDFFLDPFRRYRNEAFHER